MVRPIDTMKRWWHLGDLPADRQTTVDRPPAQAQQAIRRLGELPWEVERRRQGIRASLEYPSTTLGRLLDQTADRFAANTALLYGDLRWSYRELLANVNRMAGGLAGLGVRKGDRVLMALPNCPEFVVTFLAVQKLGAVVVNTGPLMGPDDLAAIIKMTSAQVGIGLDLQAPILTAAGNGTVKNWVWVSLRFYQTVFKWLGYQIALWNKRGHNGDHAHHLTMGDLLNQAPARPPTIEPKQSDLALLQPTGGTTGTLKLAELSHRNLLANAMQISIWMGAQTGQERILAVLPMFHVYGLTLNLISPVFSAGAMIVMTRFNAVETLEQMARHRPTIFPLVPAICDALSNEIERQEHPRFGDSLRLCISGAAPLPAPVAERFENLTGAVVIEGYGLTEAAPVTHANLPGKPRRGSIGLPLPDTRVRVVDLEDSSRDALPGQAGEMLIAGPQVMAGYFADAGNTRAALSTDEQGVTWLHTGDVVRVDDEGYFHVLDRKKDMIIRSGMKVYPKRVEEVLLRHGEVADAAVIGRSDPVHTEMVVAIVALKRPADDPVRLAEELRLLCREHLAPYEVPAAIEFLDKLPRSALGKLLKRELRGKKPAEAVVAGDGGNGKAVA
ncbi:MAG TPA: AMP-binding protein [Tepidisphaeraceae bacterium]|jgi:long-chain acyl-CoA synthetase